MAVQNKIFMDFGVRVDQVLQGHGTTNTGNLARRCFKDPKKFANSLEINEKLVDSLATIISLFKCKEELKLDELETFCRDAYQFYYETYPWCRMSPTVHKLLMHGCQIARILPMPLAYYAEDANESWHKWYRKNITEHSRQKYRLERITDVFNRAVYMSDPKLSFVYLDERMKLAKEHEFSPAALALKYIKERQSINKEESDTKNESIFDDDISISFHDSDEENLI